MKLTISTTPHISAKHTVSSIMRDVVIALLPCVVASCVFFGINALVVILTTVASCVLFEYLTCKYVMKIKNSTDNYSAVITGLLLAFNLPSNMPIPMIFVGSFVAIVVCKMAFGGLGKNVFNPALVGRVFLFISFPVAMTLWPVPSFDFFEIDAVTAATTLNLLKNSGEFATIPTYGELFLGYRGGCLGETSVLAILIGFLYMIYKRIVTWHISVVYLATVFLYCLVFYYFTGNEMYNPIIQVMAGGLMLGACFMATDYVTSPMSKSGKVVFAIGCGLLTCIIRFYGSYPEGVSFAILIMNAFVPMIDKNFQGRFFGVKE